MMITVIPALESFVCFINVTWAARSARNTVYTNNPHTAYKFNLSVGQLGSSIREVCAQLSLCWQALSCFYCSDSLRPFYHKDTVKTWKHSQIKSGRLYRSCVWWVVVHVVETPIWTLSDPVKLDDELQPNVIHQNERSSELFTQTRTI